jgi:hypothetical protein
MAELSSVDYAFLAILRAENRKISNNELNEIYGFRLVGKSLKRLLDARYIVTDKKKSPYEHVVAPAGDRALAGQGGVDDDHVEKGEGRSVREKQLWAGLVALQHLLAGLPATATATATAKEEDPVDLDGRIRSAYGKLASTPGAWVDLTALRGQLADVPKADLDRALRAMLRDDDVRLEPEPFGHRVGDAERQAAVHIGGEDRHKLAIGSR